MMAQTQAHMQAPWQYTASPDMDDAMLREWTDLLQARTGILLPVSRKSFLLTNLHTRMRELGVADYRNYFRMVTDGYRGQVEWEILVDRLTVHETRFFRDSDALGLIRRHYLEPLKELSPDKSYTVHAWSVGCATGEEPYSLAMLLDDEVGKKSGLYYGITASDVSRTALRTGREAVYHLRRVKNVPFELADKYLESIGPEHVKVVDSLRSKVCFTQLNLLALEDEPVREMDIILCQNVLIYFGHEFRNRVLNQLVSRLKPNGMLILGPGEIFSWSHPQLRVVRHDSTQAYRRVADGGAD